MDKFIGIIEQKIMPVANRIGTQRHMTAIRKGIIAHYATDDRRLIFYDFTEYPD